MAKINILASTLLLVLAGAQSDAETTKAMQPEAAPKMMRPDGWASELDLQYWATATFHADMVSTITKLGTANGPEQVSVLMDAAELYLTHMLLFEAGSILEELQPETKTQTRRHRALTDAVHLLNGIAAEDFETSPLFAQERLDRGFWASLQAIASADVEKLNSNIKQSFVGLGQQSRAVLRAMLPVFIEAAVETGQEEYAAASLRLLEELPDLANAPTGYFLRGRAEERRGNESTALEAYFTAAEGWDRYAARARLAVADMALRDGGRGALLAAQSTLTKGMESWRGNRYELELLKRLTRINAEIENDVEALMNLGKILGRFPHTPEAATAQGQAQELLAKVYDKGKAGDYTLAGWMDVHLRLMPLFRYAPGFSGHTEKFGDYVLELGATDLAIQEYRRALRLTRESPEGSAESDVDTYFRLNLKLATAQMRAGLLQDSKATLDLMTVPKNRPNQDAYALLRGKVLDDLGDRGGLLETYVAAPTIEHLRRQGLALAEEGRWALSNDVFLQLWDNHPQDFSLQDATRLLIAANRSEDVETAGKVVRAFPNLTDSKPLIDLAKSLNFDPPALLPLRADNAAERLDRLENAFETIKNSSISP